MGDKFNAMADVIANDNYDGNITASVSNDSYKYNFSEKGVKKITYTVSDSAGNVAVSEKVINVTYSCSQFFIFFDEMFIVRFHFFIISSFLIILFVSDKILACNSCKSKGFTR